MAGAAPAARPQPRKLCTGTLDELKQPKLSESNTYFVASFKIKGVEGLGAYGNILYRPEWFGKDFNPAIYAVSNDPTADNATKKQASSMEFVYAKNINSGDKTRLSVLQGLAGSDKRYQELCRALEELPDYKPETVGDLLSSFLLDGSTIGYQLKQKSEKTTFIGSDGTPQTAKVLKDGFEVEYFFYNTEKIRTQLAASADKSNIKAQAGGKPQVVQVAFAA